jgi:3-deoxy-D-manno-octulosonate 8-phosphate phosphatase (KDO 8-P phosphatase)
VPLSPTDVAARARALQVLVFDVDGVLTDGSIVIASDGSESKQFSIRDGAALVWVQREGLTVALLSGRSSEVTTRRADELGIRIVAQGSTNKREAYRQMAAANGFQDEQVAYMGDDLLDLPVMATVALSAAPADAADEVRSRVDWVSTRPGGRGAVREFIEMILKARGRWDAVVEAHGR